MTFCASPFELDDFELACGLVFGRQPPTAGDDDRSGPVEPLPALEAAILPSLRRSPCVVSFSGGRDSSAVLAVAAGLARREGLPVPIPASNVFPTGSTADESAWQELVVRHLRLDDWVRIDAAADLDCLGRSAREGLVRHGLLWPFNAHFHKPLFEVARGGVLLTGVGGDELLGTSRWARAAAVLARSERPVPRDLARVGVALSPGTARKRVLRSQAPASLPWLTAEAGERFLDTWSAQLADEPLRWSRRWRWWRGLRSVGVGLRSLDLLAADHDTLVTHPLANRQFALAAGRTASTLRIFERTDLLRALFAGVLPNDVIERRSKAFFDEVFWGAESRRFVEPALEVLAEIGISTVDAPALRAVWRSERPDPHSFLLLQALWLFAAKKVACGDNKPSLVFGPVAQDHADA